MSFNGFGRSGFVVAAGYGEQDPSISECLHPTLEGGEGFSNCVVPSNLKVFPAIVANYAAPECIVEVDNTDFLGSASRSTGPV